MLVGWVPTVQGAHAAPPSTWAWNQSGSCASLFADISNAHCAFVVCPYATVSSHPPTHTPTGPSCAAPSVACNRARHGRIRWRRTAVHFACCWSFTLLLLVTRTKESSGKNATEALIVIFMERYIARTYIAAVGNIILGDHTSYALVYNLFLLATIHVASGMTNECMMIARGATIIALHQQSPHLCNHTCTHDCETKYK